MPVEFERHDHAHLAGAFDHGVMHIARHHALADFERSGAAQRHVLADGRNRVRNRGLDRHAAHLGGLDLLHVGADVERDLRDHLDQALELFVARNEVGLGIDLDDDALVARCQRADQALRCDAAGLFGGLRQTLLAQPVDRRLHVAVVLGERLLAVHHADAGRLAQVLDHRRRDCCHCCSPLACQGDRGAAVAASPPSTTRSYVNWRLVAGRLRPARCVIPLPRSSPWPGPPSHRLETEVRPLRRSCGRCRDRVRPAASSGRCRDR